MVIAHQSLGERRALLFEFFDVLSNRSFHIVNLGRFCWSDIKRDN
jgi:hypothetical protein